MFCVFHIGVKFLAQVEAALAGASCASYCRASTDCCRSSASHTRVFSRRLHKIPLTAGEDA